VGFAGFHITHSTLNYSLIYYPGIQTWPIELQRER
jgi:hypothetical protein